MLGRITKSSLGVSRMFGYNEEDLIGRNVNQHMPQPFARNHDSFIQNYRD